MMTRTDTPYMTTVTIISALAMRRAHDEQDFSIHYVWSGDVPGITLDNVFRFFNRVDDADADKLESIGYTLPSLSVDDLVTIDGDTYQVRPLGFERVEVPEPCGWCRRCVIHDDPGGCLEVYAWEREQMRIPS